MYTLLLFLCVCVCFNITGVYQQNEFMNMYKLKVAKEKQEQHLLCDWFPRFFSSKKKKNMFESLKYMNARILDRDHAFM